MLLDANIVLRVAQPSDPDHLRVARANSHYGSTHPLFICPQVLFESRVVLTRPATENGFGLSAKDFATLIGRVRSIATLLPDPEDLVDRWLRICDTYGIVGKQSHDARLVAWMEAYSVGTILTLNARHFRPYSHLTVLTP